MAADESNYNGKKLSDMVDGVAVDHNEALWFGLTVAQVKERFYLDYVHSTGQDGTEGFIGGCYFGSANYEMHNTTRLGTLKVMTESSPGVWREYRLFWDGGLNTKGQAFITGTVSTVFTSYTLSFLFKSAFHFNSSSYGFAYRWRNDANTDWEAWIEVNIQPDEGVVLANQTKSLNHIVPIKRPDTEMLKSMAQVKPLYSNSEGPYSLAEILTLYPSLKPIQLQLNVWTNSPTTYYINDDVIIAGGSESTFTGLWANADMSGGKFTTSMQLWIDARYYYTYGYNVPEDIWCFLSLVDSTPPEPEPTYNTYDYVFFTSNTSLTAEEISDIMMSSPTGPGWITGTIYNPLPPLPNTDKWYTTNALTTLVSNGWYVQGNYAIGATRAYKIISGIVVEDWEYEK